MFPVPLKVSPAALKKAKLLWKNIMRHVQRYLPVRLQRCRLNLNTCVQRMISKRLLAPSFPIINSTNETIMDFQRFFKLLKRFSWILVLIPIVASAVTYFLVQDLPKEYKSNALISTGLADQSQRLVIEDKQADYFVVTQQFNNIIEFLTMKKNVNMLSYKLVLHDLENPEDAFNSSHETFASLDSNDRREVIQGFRNMLAEGKIITPEDNQKYPMFDYL